VPKRQLSNPWKASDLRVEATGARPEALVVAPYVRAYLSWYTIAKIAKIAGIAKIETRLFFNCLASFGSLGSLGNSGNLTNARTCLPTYDVLNPLFGHWRNVELPRQART
jgi:hypothetical protein